MLVGWGVMIFGCCSAVAGEACPPAHVARAHIGVLFSIVNTRLEKSLLAEEID